jgi:C-terminal processing protease CtpA/Prc
VNEEYMRSSRFIHGLPWLLAILALVGLAPALQAQEKSGYLGIYMDCTECEQGMKDGATLWWFSTPPQVTWVFESGPAAKAGLREGDLIIAVNGVDITTEEGGRLFGGLQVGVPVRFTVRRGEREATLVVTPGSPADAFGKEYAAVMRAPEWDSVQVQLKLLYERLPKLQIALREAERALAVTEAEAQRTSSESKQRLTEIQRAQIDSISRQVDEWQKLVRVYTDSLAARTLYVKPAQPPEADVRVVAPRGEERSIVIYSDAVAGARFKELKRGSELPKYFDVMSGLLVIDIVESTPAYTAGLREGDVVVAVNGEPVSTVAELRKLLRGSDKADLTFVREGQKQTCTIPSRKKG